MHSYNSSTPLRDWSGCKQCRLHSTRRNVVVRRSGFIFNGDITPLRIDTSPFNKEQRNDFLQTQQEVVTQILSYYPQTPPQENTKTQADFHPTKYGPDPTQSGYRESIRSAHTTRPDTRSPTSAPTSTPIPSFSYVLFIGEAPGQSEDMQGEPFVGPSYGPLTAIMREATRPHPNYWRLPTNPPIQTGRDTDGRTGRPTSESGNREKDSSTRQQPIPGTEGSLRPNSQTLPQNGVSNRGSFSIPPTQEDPYPSLRSEYSPKGFFFTITNTVCCRPIHTPDTTPNIKQHGNNRPPNEAEQNHCEPHLLELLSSQAYTHIVCLGEVALERYTRIQSKYPLPNPLHILHPAWFLRQDYLLLDIIKAGRSLRKHTT